MKELRDIAARYRAAYAEGQRAALATVMKVRGSSYRRPGARMLVLDDGETLGSVSGGCLEGDVTRKALFALAIGKPALLVYDTHEEAVLGVGCRGEISVLVEPLTGESTLDELDGWLARREIGLVATRIRGSRVGARLLLSEAGTLRDEIGDPQLLADAHAILAGRRVRPCADDDVCFEIIRPPPRLVLFGAGPDAEPVARIANQLGWHVTVVEVRAGNRTRARFAHTDAVLCGAPDDVCAQISFGADAAVVIMTHNDHHDRRLLELLVSSPVAYLGLLGPRERAARLFQGLGGSERVHAPVGLDIGAETPEEIALSILAEIRASFAGRNGGPLRDRTATIHSRD
ncbi:MAG TPA: XdhC family protein [Burkholderiales bacterium]|nr:XdhC family protein [Burkholderiales bacterium]